MPPLVAMAALLVACVRPGQTEPPRAPETAESEALQKLRPETFLEPASVPAPLLDQTGVELAVQAEISGTANLPARVA